MKAAIVAGLFGFGCALAVVLGQRAGGGDALTVAGVMVGIVVSIPVCGVLLLLHRANDAMTQRALSGIVRQNAPETAITHYQTFPDAGARVGPDLPVTRHSSVSARPMVDAEYRRYGSDLPRIERGTQTVRHYKRNRLGPGGGSVAAVEITNTTPHREPNPGADLLVPLGQAVATGIIAALVAAVLASVAGRDDVLRITAVTLSVVLAVAWLWRLGVVDSLLSVVERITQELDGPEEEAEPEAHTMTVNAGQARAEAGRIAGERASTVKTAELLGFVSRCATLGTSEGAQGVKPNQTERARYAELRDMLISLGIGQWKDENRKRLGWSLVLTPTEAAPIIAQHVRELRDST